MQSAEDKQTEAGGKLYRILDIISLLFLARVVGQLGVFLNIFPFLPPMDEWQSGLLLYPLLLTSQVAILGIMVLLRRTLPRLRRKLGSHARKVVIAVRVFATIYALIMILRFVFFIASWVRGVHFLGGWIPIVFHWLLAGYLFTLASILDKREEQ